MLQKLRSVFASRFDLTYAAYVGSLDIETKPFVKALFLRAATLLDEARTDFKNDGMELKVDKAKPIADFACLALSTIAYDITIQAGNAINVPAVFLPYEPVPKYASVVVAFSMHVSLGIHIRLKEDGVSIDAQEALGRTAMQFFTFHPHDEGREQFARAFTAFQETTANRHQLGNQWKEACVNLVLPYVLQWTTTDENHKTHDYPELFGSLLKVILGASNFRTDIRK